ncbi:uncharacterized protein LOC118190749 [Stegodyphus dumicola]|uniref:uncharacterized protein LOC118190749 n=1 Tax=Stegodyphus dumicola TaxID=202533 RepID=UPI0015A96F2D|nr:uncharacterized protein LOC118190749 [Stegodyphus dumicola]
MAEAKMDLRMWTFNQYGDQELAAEDSDPVSAVLGLRWDRRDDSLTISVQREIVKRDLSKRRLLSLIHAVFDPLGFFVPVILPAKLILQEAWATKSTWDKPLPDELQTRFERWYERLPSLSSLKLPRRMGHGIKDSWTLHVFCDASQAAYATVIYLRSKKEDKVFVKFVIAKSRISPVKKITIPRLELLACVLGARLARYTVETLCLVDVPIYYWTDATVALSWIQREENWGVFVNNRVKEIRKLSKQECWRHIPGKLNPADVSSRGFRVFCWVLRFTNKLLKKPSYSSDTLTVEEKTNAETFLWSLEERKQFQEKGDSVHGLVVVRDNDGVLRVKTKIIERDDEFCFLYPLLLPSKHYLTECLIREYHEKNCHAGVQILAAKLRERYWIISSKRNIRSCVSRCVVCRRFTAKALSTSPIQLPLDRIRDSAVFETTGVDLCGPLLLRPKRKRR